MDREGQQPLLGSVCAQQQGLRQARIAMATQRSVILDTLMLVPPGWAKLGDEKPSPEGPPLSSFLLHLPLKLNLGWRVRAPNAVGTGSLPGRRAPLPPRSFLSSQLLASSPQLLVRLPTRPSLGSPQSLRFSGLSPLGLPPSLPPLTVTRATMASVSEPDSAHHEAWGRPQAASGQRQIVTRPSLATAPPECIL